MKTYFRARRVVLGMGIVLAVAVSGSVFSPLPAGAQGVGSGDPPFDINKPNSVGIEGTIPKDPPQTGAIISVPGNGQTFTNTPITVSGICPDDVLVKVFKNNAFAGSVQCENGSFSLIVDLFSGVNILTARVFDDLDQEGPPSNQVTVTFNDTRPGVQPRISLTSNFAKRGADPGEELTWPVILSGGRGPYAFSIDWGDGTAPDLMSQAFPGEITLKHKYEKPGVYRIVVKATDADGNAAFLQLVGLANGPLSQEGTTPDVEETGGEGGVRTRLIIWPMMIFIPFIITTFWLGKRYERRRVKQRMKAGLGPY